ncbi:unnamed protein product, partial [Owenia fusiformis]
FIKVSDVHITFNIDSVSGTTITSTDGLLSGTLWSSPYFVSGKVGKTISFDGTGQMIDFGNQRATCLGNLDNCVNGHSMVFWFYHNTPTISTTYYYYISSGGQNSGPTSHGIAVRINADDTLGFYHATTANKQWDTTVNNIATIALPEVMHCG